MGGGKGGDVLWDWCRAGESNLASFDICHGEVGPGLPYYIMHVSERFYSEETMEYGNLE